MARRRQRRPLQHGPAHRARRPVDRRPERLHPLDARHTPGPQSTRRTHRPAPRSPLHRHPLRLRQPLLLLQTRRHTGPSRPLRPRRHRRRGPRPARPDRDRPHRPDHRLLDRAQQRRLHDGLGHVPLGRRELNPLPHERRYRRMARR
ncbi:unnamed protein product [Ectocarpus fasciculatus]